MLFPNERLQQIENILDLQNQISIEELQERFRISKATVYRDLKFLEDRGRIQVVRGRVGRVSHPNLIYDDQPYYEKTNLNTEEKKRIAKAACRMIRPGMTIFLDSSTTVFAMCSQIAMMRNIRVVTNDIRIASTLIDAPGVSIFVSGGDLRKNYYTLICHSTNRMLADITADIGFVSCDAITKEHGCMITNGDEVPIKKQILEISVRRILLCDHAKFNRTAFMSVAPVDSFDEILVGREISDEIFASFKKSGVELTRV